jgi:hypothetical protein
MATVPLLPVNWPCIPARFTANQKHWDYLCLHPTDDIGKMFDPLITIRL